MKFGRIKSAVVCALMLSRCWGGGEEHRKPNLVFVFADQWRAQATGYAGDPNLRGKTPHLDCLAEEGKRGVDQPGLHSVPRQPAYGVVFAYAWPVHKRCAAEPGSGDDRQGLQGRQIRYGLCRQVARRRLPEGLELDDLGAGISVLRNPVIARAFNEIGLIEGWGTGIRLAQAELAGIKLPPAEVKLKGLFTQISSVWRWPSNLDPAQQKILEMAAANGQVTAVQVADLLQVSDRTARNRLSTLATEGLLVKIGATKNAKYHLT